jgi:type IV pilus assembly protein PilC
MAVDIRNLNTPEKQKKPDTSLGDIFQRDISLFPYKFSDKNKEAFYLALSTMVSAGVDIISSFELVEADMQGEKNKKLVQEIKEAVVRGSSFGEALRLNGHFSAYEYYSVKIGEETGRLGEVLDELAMFYEKKLKQRRQFISALSYPMLILTASAGAVGFMLYFIVPMFEDVFKRFGGELPSITRMIIHASKWLSTYGPFLVLGLLAFAAFIFINRKKNWLIFYWHSLLLKIPVFGKLFTKIYLSRFSSSMALLTAAKVPLLECIKMNSKIIDFYPIRDALHQIELDIMNGKSLHSSMGQFKIFDVRMVALVKIGEEVNKLDTFFRKLNKQYSEEAEHTTTQLNTFLEPLMIVMLGLIVGFILVAMYLPMFQLSNNMA